MHGYRVAFDEVAVQMGSFAHYSGHGAIVTFQWPTGMNFWNYITDCPRAERYIPDIERLLAVLASPYRPSTSTSWPIAAARRSWPRRWHDCGRAIRRMTGGATGRRYRIGNVIFVASDVDLKTFARDHVQPALDLVAPGDRVLLPMDRALGFSSLIAGASRLGQPDISDLTVEELGRLAADPTLQAIDVTDVRGAHEMGGMAGHGYWYANEVISTDVTLSLRYPIPPGQRCLVNKPGTRVWQIPNDYLDCVAGRLLDRFPELKP